MQEYNGINPRVIYSTDDVDPNVKTMSQAGSAIAMVDTMTWIQHNDMRYTSENIRGSLPMSYDAMDLDIDDACEDIDEWDFDGTGIY